MFHAAIVKAPPTPGKGGADEINIVVDNLPAKSINSLPAIGAHERQVFDKLLWGLVTSTIFVRC